MKTAIRPVRQDVFAVVLVASAEDWSAVRESLPDLRPGLALNREWISRTFGRRRVVFVDAGEEPIAAAATAQHAVDQWRPDILLSTADADAFYWVAENNRVPISPVRDEAFAGSTLLDGFEERLARAVPPSKPKAPPAQLAPEEPDDEGSVADAVVVFPDSGSEGPPTEA